MADSPAKDDKKVERTYPFDFHLSRPLTTHGGEKTVLTLRELTADDMVEMRTSPIVITYSRQGVGDMAINETRIEERYDLMILLAAKMSGVDEILLRSLVAKDFRKLVTLIGEIWREAEGE